MRNLVSLRLTDAFGRLHNSSPDGGCHGSTIRYWYGGEEMYQFFCVLTNLKAVLICRALVSESHRHILSGLLRINQQFYLLKALCFARSGFLPLINSVVKPKESKLRCFRLKAFRSDQQFFSFPIKLRVAAFVDKEIMGFGDGVYRLISFWNWFDCCK